MPEWLIPVVIVVAVIVVALVRGGLRQMSGREPYDVGQLVKIVRHANVGEIGRIAHQRGTTNDCGLEEPDQPVYMVWLMGVPKPYPYKHSELEAVGVVPLAKA